MKKLLIPMLLLCSCTVMADDSEGYAVKCAELIEQSKSPASNWTTSLEEAAMAGECIGVIKVVDDFVDNHYASQYYIYSCSNRSIFSKAKMIVDANAQSISSVIRTLCRKH